MYLMMSTHYRNVETGEVLSIDQVRDKHGERPFQSIEVARLYDRVCERCHFTVYDLCEDTYCSNKSCGAVDPGPKCRI